MDEPASANSARSTLTIVRFGTFDVDLRSGELRKGRVKIKLYGQPFSVLALLLERPGEVVTREELQQKLWAGDTFVDFEHGLNKAINKVREALDDDADNPRFIETLPRRGYRFIGSLEGVSTGATLAPKTGTPLSGKQPGAIDSLAVLPLENVSGDPEMEYLSDGIAETLINTLAQLRKIRVVPRTLAFRHRGPAVDVLKVGRELGVRAVLAGRMMQRGEDLIVSVELVDVARQAHLWGGRYNRKMMDLVVLQEELATEISEKLRLQLTGEEKKRLRKRPTQSHEAFRLLLQAQYVITPVSPEGLRRGIALCQMALEKDPGYAEAYARESWAYAFMGIFAFLPPTEAYSRGMEAAKKALELDDTLANAHVALGYTLFWQRWDILGAEDEARRSIELNPDSADGYSLLDFILLARGRCDEAIAAGRRAVEVAPLYGYASFNLGVTYCHARQFDKAIEELCRTVDLEPGSPLYHGVLAHCYAAAGQQNSAIRECEKALALTGDAPFLRLHSAVAYAILHEVAGAHKLLEEAEQNWKPNGISAFWIACVHACLGEKDAAFAWLERAFQERCSFLVWVKIFYPLARLHGDPRFDALVKRIGIPT